MGDQTALRPPTASELGASGIPSEIGMASESTARPHTTRFSLKVIRANGVTSLQFANGIKWLPSSNNRRFLVTATDGATTNTTADVKSEGKSVVWDVTLGEFRVEPGSNLTLRLVAKRRLHSDVLVGAVELPFESLCASFPREVTIVAGESITTRSTQVTLSVEIAVREVCAQFHLRVQRF
ncbi:hypothetical protein BC834DRAFT_1002619 [Gloeopeniophorella convolvens]|nr:hypothetical protein BC834DRAFT_847217 [Gloeopeniophorella convolvens]KAI0262462.1 hypothetical protein BC834DRAFT_1002619 [Gloeopeniophorella convolvens]